MIDAMGHEFGPDLVCECGVSSETHQRDPTRCGEKRRAYTASGDALALLRASLGIPLRIVASQCGMSVASAARAVNGRIGGHGRNSPEARQRVAVFLDGAKGERQ